MGCGHETGIVPKLPVAKDVGCAPRQVAADDAKDGNGSPNLSKCPRVYEVQQKEHRPLGVGLTSWLHCACDALMAGWKQAGWNFVLEDVRGGAAHDASWVTGKGAGGLPIPKVEFKAAHDASACTCSCDA